MTKKVVITGVTGQVGSYFAEFLLEKEYEIIGIKRRSSTSNTSRIDHIKDENFTLVEGDIVDPSSVNQIVREYQPDEIYNLAALSHVGTSFKQPAYTFQVNAGGVLNLLESIRLIKPDTKFYQASSSENFGNSYTEKDGNKYQDEDTPFKPDSPYAVAKVAAHHLVNNYRRAYDIFGCCGILFNNESPRRGEEFVTRKITKWIGEFWNWHTSITKAGFMWDVKFDKNFIYPYPCEEPKFPKLRLGNIDTYRDWGHSKDYIKAIYLMLQQEEPDDYVVSTGKTYSVRQFLDAAFRQIGITDFSNYIVIDPEFYRPSDVEFLRGNPEKAKRRLGWESSTTFEELVNEMVQYDIQYSSRQPGTTTLAV